jgi:hypothetical protein
MNNTNKQKIYNYIITIFSNSKKIKDLHYLIASVFFLDTDINIDEEYFLKPSDYYLNLNLLIRNLKYLNFNKIIIFIIDNENVEPKLKKINDDYYICIISFDEFFKKKEIYDFLTVSDNIHKNTIFIFKNINWINIVAKFRSLNIIVSGGSNTKKHILSPVQLRLSQFILAIGWDQNDSINYSFHGRTKANTKPTIDFTSDKEILKLMNALIDKQKNESITLDKLKNDINNSNNENNLKKSDTNE